MIYLRALCRQGDFPDNAGYPLSSQVCQNLDQLAFTAPVTFLAGDNGSGKTTLMELLAAKLSALRIDARQAEAGRKSRAFTAAQSYFRIEMVKKPQRSFFFHAEGFIRYEDDRARLMDELEADFADMTAGVIGRSNLSRALSAQPYARSLHEIRSMYDRDLAQQSHGEGFIDFFSSRLITNGLYLLDEPESALSYFNQYVLLGIFREAVEQGCQLIVSTHSPVLMAYPGAHIYELREGVLEPIEYRELENLNFLRSFLNDTEGYVRRLFE